MKSVHRLGISVLALVANHAALAQTTPAPDLAPDTQSLGERDSAAQGRVDPAQAGATAQQSTDDIIVTATKREQTLQDVPVSVAVTSEQTIQRAQIRDLIDLQSVVPSLTIGQGNSVGQTNFYIRGFGNGAGNVGIEGSVGVFIDGVYRSRSAASLTTCPRSSGSRCCAGRSRPCSARTCRPARSTSSPNVRNSSPAAAWT